MNLAGIIHNLPTRGIAKFLLENPWSSQVEITDSLSLSSSTVRWHLEQLGAFGALESASRAQERTYNLRDPNETRKIVESGNISSSQRLTSGFASLWDF